jgi:hypothetical protein
MICPQKRTLHMPPTLATYYDHRVHQIPPVTSEPQDFISEDDLDTFEGYLRD